jgi:acyl dehydratase
MLELRTLFFEDLSVGMTETLNKTVASSDVIGFAQLTGDRNRTCRQDVIWGTHRSRALYGKPDLGGAGHLAAWAGWSARALGRRAAELERTAADA